MIKLIKQLNSFLLKFCHIQKKFIRLFKTKKYIVTATRIVDFNVINSMHNLPDIRGKLSISNILLKISGVLTMHDKLY